MSLLGIDNKLRTYMLLHDNWKQVSNLLIGLPNLFKFLNEFSFEENKTVYVSDR